MSDMPGQIRVSDYGVYEGNPDNTAALQAAFDAAVQTQEPARHYLTEARAILAGDDWIRLDRRHLEALEEYYSGQLIQLANDLDMLKRKALGA